MIRIFRIFLLLLFSFAGTVLLFTRLYAEHDGTPSSTLKTHTSATQIYSYKIVNIYPHDRNAFTQGLAYQNGLLYEGTGLRGKSSLRKVDLKTGKLLKNRILPDQIFGEGITVYNDKIIQLTWNSGIGFVYDRHHFDLIDQFRYSYEGWGITHDGERLITSDGTSIIRFLEPESFKEIGKMKVHDHNGPIKNLNELEYVKGQIYANVWNSDRIAMIAPNTGQVTGWIDLEGLLTLEGPTKPVDVLNGIAYDSENDRLFVTGKLWPKLFEIRLIER